LAGDYSIPAETTFSPLDVQPEERPISCSVCGGSLVEVSSIADGSMKRANNRLLWNRSSCAELIYAGDCPVCTTCWHAYNSMTRTWSRLLERPEGFEHPLNAAIQDFPLPSADDVRSGATYIQRFHEGAFTDQISLRTNSDRKYMSKVRDYCDVHDLVLTVDRRGLVKREVYITAETATPAQTGEAH
jgi:hypothetical protein